MLVYHVAYDGGMLLCGAKDYCLLVGFYLSEHLFHTIFVAVSHHDVAVVEVALGVGLVLVDVAFHVVVGIILVVVDVALRYPHSERREVTVGDALFQRVAIHRIAEILICVSVFPPSWRGSHAELVCVAEIFHQPAPFALVVCASTVALVYYDEVEEVLRILHEVWVSAIVVRHERLEYRKIYVSACGHIAVVFRQFLRCHPHHRVFVEVAEVVLRLVGENVSVRDEQDSRFPVRREVLVPSCLKQFPANLKSRVGLSRACCHGEQYSPLFVCHCRQHLVDGNLLIVARRAVSVAVESAEVKVVSPLVVVWKSHLPQLLWSRESLRRSFFAWNDIFAVVVFHAHVDSPNLVAVSGIGISYVEHFGIAFCLFHSFAHVSLVAFGFYHGKFLSTVFQHVVCLLGILVFYSFHSSRRNLVCPLFRQNDAVGHLFPTYFI